ncbi:hypothetical protein [Mycetohabitans endofungorum]
MPLPTHFAAYAYELFAGMPIHRPAPLSTARVVVGFQLTVQL